MKLFTRTLAAIAVSSLITMGAQAQTPGVALSYNTDDYVTLPDNLLAGLTGDFTIETWVYWNGPSDNRWQRIFDFGNQNQYMYLTPSGKEDASNTSRLTFAISFFGNCCEQRLQAPVELTPGTWNHIAITLNDFSDIGRMYLNGTLVATNTSMTLDAGDVAQTQNWLGRSKFSDAPFFDPYFNGIIDEFRISNVIRYTTDFTPQTSEFTPDANTVALYHFNEGSGQTSADASGNGFTAILGATTAAEGSDPTWTTGSILPVTILHFAAQKAGGGVDLKWRASVTGNGGQFVVERSTDGIRYQAVGTVHIPANAGTREFSFSDRQAAAGKNYYRLRVVEAGSPARYSAVVVVDLGRASQFDAYPTITSSQLFIKIPAPTTVGIYNSNGVLVKRIELQTSQNISVSELSQGVYQLKFGEAKETVRFVKM